MKFATISPTVHFVNASGQTKAVSPRPLRVLPGGAGFGVVRKGRVLPVVPHGTDGRTAICALSGSAFAETDCRVAKLADLGLPTKSEAKASEPKAPRTEAQQAATVAMLTAQAAKRPGDAKAAKALATAKARLAEMRKGSTKTAKRSLKAHAAKVAQPSADEIATALKASGVDLIALIRKLAS